MKSCWHNQSHDINSSINKPFLSLTITPIAVSYLFRFIPSRKTKPLIDPLLISPSQLEDSNFSVCAYITYFFFIEACLAYAPGHLWFECSVSDKCNKSRISGWVVQVPLWPSGLGPLGFGMGDPGSILAWSVTVTICCTFVMCSLIY